jgi:hypothetical protein
MGLSGMVAGSATGNIFNPSFFPKVTAAIRDGFIPKHLRNRHSDLLEMDKFVVELCYRKLLRCMPVPLVREYGFETSLL